VVSVEDKIDKIIETTTDIRLAVASLSGEVRSAGLRLDGHEVARADVETRLRAVERRMYALPTLSALVGLSGLAVALWDRIG
jgi:hypothetical protein